MTCTTLLGAIAPLMLITAGCQQSAPPPPRVSVPPVGQGAVVLPPEPRPLPADAFDLAGEPGPTMEAPQIYRQQLRQEPAYVTAHGAVGNPRLAVYVNRSFDGRVIPAELPRWRQGTTYTADVTLTRRGARIDGTRFEPIDPADRRPEAGVHDPRRDELGNRALDFAAVETILTDLLSAGNKVPLMSPSATRSRLSPAALQRLESGEATALGEVAERLGADVLIHVAARPSQQNFDGPSVRLVAEAIDTATGLSVGRAVVDVPPPLDKQMINRYAGYVAAKLMDDLTTAWTRQLQQPAPRQAEAEGAAGFTY
jgi:hypothetical protein